ncbi:MAG: radical SAM protein [Candidatus Omnitrophota bacterium]|nr:MAG: radical SAM protein [Candidatus Omnitrophota bacterium]
MAGRKYPLEILSQKIKLAYARLSKCDLCPRECRVNRLKGERGYCGMDAGLYISSFGPHFGEEPELVGKGGSGTIFLTGCNLKCIFCQNYEISHFMIGKRYSVEELVDIMLYLQDRGCVNINFVTPTHYTPHIMKAVFLARERGLEIPVVYNCGGYEKVETLKLLDGFIDIYMPDAKFMEPDLSGKYLDACDYPQVMRKAIKEMYIQVRDMVIENGIARKGLLIRHLIMPEGIENARKILEFIAREISVHTYVNIMDQYHPCYRAADFPEINRRVISQEYRQVIKIAHDLGFLIR